MLLAENKEKKSKEKKNQSKQTTKTTVTQKKKDNDGLVDVYPVNFGQVTTFKPQGEGKRCSCPKNSVEDGESPDTEEG